MKLKLKSDDNGNFGFVEEFKPYVYDTKAITVKMLVDAGNKMSEPYVMRGGKFIPAKQIDEEMGIEKYVRSKKPFYSVLGKGNLIVKMRIVYDLDTMTLLPEKCNYEVYGVVSNSLTVDGDDIFVEIRKFHNLNNVILDWLEGLAREIVTFNGDRAKFLKYRF